MSAPTPYSVHLRVGTHVWDVASGDDPDYGPLAGVRHAWDARQDDGWPTQHNPTPLVFGVIVEEGTDFSDVDQGTGVHFTFTPDGYAAPLVTYGGTVRDLVAYPHPRGMVYEITAIDHLQKLKEDYQTTASVSDVLVPTGTLWAHLLAPWTGTGTRRLSDDATLPDPFGGQASKPATFPNNGGTWSAPWQATGSTWDMLTQVMALAPFRWDAATGVRYSPFYQRGLLTYQLGVDGNLLPARPFLGSWGQAGPLNSPNVLQLGAGVWSRAGGNVSADLLATRPTRWARERVEPNRVITTIGLATAVQARPHAGPDITRTVKGDYPPSSESGDATWILSGLENPNQWGTAFTIQGARDPDVVAGWFTLPTAMQTLVAVDGIDPRHTPTGTGRQEGMLSGAALVIPAGGDWRVEFTLRRTLPDDANPSTGGWSPTTAIQWDQLPAGLTWANMDPTLTWADLATIHP